VNPKIRQLARKNALLAIRGGDNIWKTQFSGKLLPDSVAKELEALVIGDA
jgi:hypothetical protein